MAKPFINVTRHRKKSAKILRRAVKQTKRGRKSRKSLKVLGIIVAVLLVLGFAFLSLNGRLFHFGDWNWFKVFSSLGLTEATAETSTENVNIHFIDVGQGDCELIVTPKFNLLIDGGESENYPTIVNYLNQNNITHLDYVIASHPHSDHIGSLGYVIKAMSADHVIMPELPESQIPTTSAYEKLLSGIDDADAEILFARPGDTYQLSEEAQVEILAPVAEYADLNNVSVVAKLIHGENSCLFTGDIEDKAEEDIIDSGADLRSDVLKIAHHGSNSSSSYAFLKAVGGRYAVIGVGSPNSYGHPTEDTLAALEDTGYEILRTDLDGNIVMTSNGADFSVMVTSSAQVKNAS
jgi:beta-lactamase superfamily II metal-dependent hydrolase